MRNIFSTNYYTMSFLELLTQLSVTWTLCLVLFVLWYFEYRRQYRREECLPPGSFGLPFLGETLSLARKKVDFFRERQKMYGDIYKTHLFLRPTVRVSGAHNVKRILKGENFIVKSKWPSSVQNIMGFKSLSQSQGKRHSVRKRQFMENIVGKKLAHYFHDICTIIDGCISEWKLEKSVKIGASVERLTIRAILCILYGNTVSEQDLQELGTHAKTVVDNILSVPINLPGTNYNKALVARSHLEAFARKNVNTRLGSPSSMTPTMRSIVNQYRDSHGDIDVCPELMAELTDCSVELIVAGRSTTHSVIINSILLLAENPDILTKVQNELKEYSLLDYKTLTLRELDWSTLQSLPYLDHVVREVLRLRPPVGGGFRVATQTFNLNGYQIPKDWSVAFSIRETHVNQNIPRCEEFLPDRWADSNQYRPDGQRFAYIPFGAGSRSCPGKQFAVMVIKLALLELCRSSDWAVLENYQMNYYPTPLPQNDVLIAFRDKCMEL